MHFISYDLKNKQPDLGISGMEGFLLLVFLKKCGKVMLWYASGFKR